MPSKRDQLIRQAKETGRRPEAPSALERGGESKKLGYKVISVSFYTPEFEWIDRMTRALQRAGNPKANRSFVIREGVQRLMESMSNKSEGEMLQDFIEQQAKRTALGEPQSS
jgi:hypothetical protein